MSRRKANAIAHIVPPKLLKAFPSARRVKGKTPMGQGLVRARWKDEDGAIYQWDYTHGLLEKYAKKGKPRWASSIV